MIDRKSAMSDRCRCGECGGALVLEEHLVLTCESCGTLHGDAGLLADPTTSDLRVSTITAGQIESLRRAADLHVVDIEMPATADPTTSRTEAEQAVIHAAIAETEAEDAYWAFGYNRLYALLDDEVDAAKDALDSARVARRVAVDRLAAPGPKEATP